MFPALKLRVSGLDPNVNYVIMVDIVPVDCYRYKYQDSRWVVAGKADQPVIGRQVHVHPDSPATGQHWMSRTLSFHKLKLTNNVVDKQGHVSLRLSDIFHLLKQEPITYSEIPMTYTLPGYLITFFQRMLAKMVNQNTKVHIKTQNVVHRVREKRGHSILGVTLTN